MSYQADVIPRVTQSIDMDKYLIEVGNAREPPYRFVPHICKKDQFRISDILERLQHSIDSFRLPGDEIGQVSQGSVEQVAHPL